MKKILLIIVLICRIFPTYAIISKGCTVYAADSAINIKSGFYPAGVELSGWTPAQNCRVGWLGTWESINYRTPNASLVASYGDSDGKVYAIWSTAIPGVGVAIAVSAESDIDNVWADKKIAISGYSSERLYITKAFSWGNGITYVKLVTTGKALVPGVYSLSGSQQIGNYVMYDSLGESRVPVYLGLTSLNVTSKGCEVLTPNLFAEMGEVNSLKLPQPGSTYNGPELTIALHCDAEVSVNAIFSDLTSPGNTSDRLNLTSASTGSGVGFRLLKDGLAITFARPSLHNDAFGQVAIKTVSQGEHYTFVITPQYIRLGELGAGSANARAAIMFIYN